MEARWRGRVGGLEEGASGWGGAWMACIVWMDSVGSADWVVSGVNSELGRYSKTWRGHGDQRGRVVKTVAAKEDDKKGDRTR